ncbi:PREDICTED: NACHT, LRR and PYD domains-containing protein 6 [Dipodomys ordii]|uniref:NACHT, LRR and PYD domains-containing protein 6 n=1 Tax=Dipodomys ordii TaxID=10020 RepID=A0A1S3GIT9_DIPOR|nr:PREDICTED: NACHT, LRR and PYD domains-containing protein 6 [Dipodomys ordii]
MDEAGASCSSLTCTPQGVTGSVPRSTPKWAGRRGAAPAGEGQGGEDEEEDCFQLQLLYCLYETQDDAFVRQALSGLPELVLERVRFSRMDLEVLSYCVRCCPAGQALRLRACRLVAAQEKEKKSLMKRLQGSRATTKHLPVSLLRPLCEAMADPQCGLQSLTLAHCKLPDVVCQDLSEALRAAPSLTELNLLQNRLSQAGMRMLSEGLAWPKCQVQTLR